MPRRATSTSYGAVAGNPRNMTGSTGGPPSTYHKRLAWLEGLAMASARWKRILDDETGEFATNAEWLATVKEVQDRHRGRAAQSIDVTSGGQSLLSDEERVAKIAALLGRK